MYNSLVLPIVTAIVISGVLGFGVCALFESDSDYEKEYWPFSREKAERRIEENYQTLRDLGLDDEEIEEYERKTRYWPLISIVIALAFWWWVLS